MKSDSTRRQFLSGLGATAAGAACPGVLRRLAAEEPEVGAAPTVPVVLARDEGLDRGSKDRRRALAKKMLDAAIQRLTHADHATTGWRTLFDPQQRIGIKVNTLGLSTQPVVVEAIAAGLIEAGIPAEHIIIWDRFDVELAQAGYRLNKSSRGVQCRGTDAAQYGFGYRREVQVSGRIGSCFSRIVADQVDALISVPVLKDHNLAGVSLGMKNFFGAIHNPNKYHDHQCDPYIVDVVAHPFIRPKWHLTVCDGVVAQCHGGPGRHPAHASNFCGLIVGTDVVATDAIGARLIDEQRRAHGLKPLAAEGRPPRHLATASQRGFGVAEHRRIKLIEV